MNKRTETLLKKAGWYEGKKIDISNIVKIYEESGKEVFPKAKQYLEEFGNIIIYTKSIVDRKKMIPFHILDVEYLFERGYYEGLARQLELTLGEKVLKIGATSGYENHLYISESGNFYDSFGFVGNDIYECLDIILETVSLEERYSRTKSWDEMGIEQKLDEAEQKLFAEDPQGDKGIEFYNYLSGLS
ncbi:SUKH-3 domain-containing protein [Clostridium mediterraneense]|uniref:SUKH-3 domain-containing protein n=1 Tax=Clostridium mediterraneense TaxID=1805472 RepID=UPI00082B0AD6|nr:SUKH-3 domain-containing protein [Clostridium mediterraneense]